MSIKSIYLVSTILLGICLQSCEGEDPSAPYQNIEYNESSNPDQQPKNYATVKTNGQPVLLITTTEESILRVAPDFRSKEIKRIQKNDTLIYVNEISAESVKMELEGVEYEEPWLKVITTDDNQELWIFGACVRFDGINNQELQELVFTKRLGKLFGDKMCREVLTYHREMQNVQTVPAFKKLYTQGNDLRNDLEVYINEHVSKSNSELLPDFFWLDATFAGFLVSYPPQTNEYKIFRDFKHWQKLAQQTPHNDDDLFVEVMLQAYSSDSTEFIFQDWRYELPTGEAYSLLGQGVHSNVLNKIQLALSQDSLHYFRKDLLAIKDLLIDDISLSSHYWSTQESIVEELEEILAKDYPFISGNNRIELQARLKMLRDPQKNDISTNHFEQE
ncbi:MAG: hypothetical protein MK212_13175 [Saprospiraceae bacterium]|nr:hypothetical protein [Saprospiraceae bacterium]